MSVHVFQPDAGTYTGIELEGAAVEFRLVLCGFRSPVAVQLAPSIARTRTGTPMIVIDGHYEHLIEVRTQVIETTGNSLCDLCISGDWKNFSTDDPGLRWEVLNATRRWSSMTSSAGAQRNSVAEQRDEVNIYIPPTIWAGFHAAFLKHNVDVRLTGNGHTVLDYEVGAMSPSDPRERLKAEGVILGTSSKQVGPASIDIMPPGQLFETFGDKDHLDPLF
jgi:hypothetical protein